MSRWCSVRVREVVLSLSLTSKSPLEMNDLFFESTFDTNILSHSATECGVYHIYTGKEDGVNTMWVTVGTWNGKLRLVDDTFVDSEGREVLVLEEEEDAFQEWSEKRVSK